MAPSENSGVLSVTDTVNYPQKTNANSSVIELKTESTYEVSAAVMEIDKNDPRCWSTKKKLLVALGPILTGFVGY
jgi:hypothetical protein